MPAFCVLLMSVNGSVVTMIDVADPGKPFLLAEVHDGANGFNHLGGAPFLDVEGSRAFVTGRTSDTLTILDLTPLLREQLLAGNLASTEAFLPL